MQTFGQKMNRIVAQFDGEHEQEDTTALPEEEPEAFDVYIEADRITVVKRPQPQLQVKMSEVAAGTPPQPQPQPQPPPLFASIALTLSLLLLGFLVAAAIVTTFFPPVVTVMLLPKSQTLTLSGSLQLGRFIAPVTLSQSQTAPVSGRGHQYARAATGSITFYNGQFTSITIPAGIMITSASGIPIITDQIATIPKADPPLFGQTTVSAHAHNPGMSGNIPAYDINLACCGAAIKAVNTAPFHGGQNARDFSTVGQQDINKISTQLIATINRSMQGALNAQAAAHETILTLPCSPAVMADHRVGEEATDVTVTVSETCRAAAYDREALTARITHMVHAQAGKKFGHAYSSFGTVHVTVRKASITRTATPPVFLSFQAQGTWVYTLNMSEQRRITQLIAGKTKHAALQTLLSMSGIDNAIINGVDDLAKLPKSASNIHVVIVVEAVSS